MRKTRYTNVLGVAVLLLVAGLLVGCVPGDGRNTAQEPANFWWGIWHGWIAPVSLVISWFNPDRGIYEVNNTGFWYDFGFYIAVISGFGGVSLSRKNRKRDRDRD